jgi:hypothetical protein
MAAGAVDEKDGLGKWREKAAIKGFSHEARDG